MKRLKSRIWLGAAKSSPRSPSLWTHFSRPNGGDCRLTVPGWPPVALVEKRDTCQVGNPLKPNSEKKGRGCVERVLGWFRRQYTQLSACFFFGAGGGSWGSTDSPHPRCSQRASPPSHARNKLSASSATLPASSTTTCQAPNAFQAKTPFAFSSPGKKMREKYVRMRNRFPEEPTRFCKGT